MGIRVNLCRCCPFLTASVLTSLCNFQPILFMSSALLPFPSRWPQAPSLWEFLTCFSLFIYVALILTDTASSYSSRSPLLLSIRSCWRGFGPQSIAGGTGVHWIYSDGVGKRRQSPANLSMGLPTSSSERFCQTKSPEDQ